MQAADMNKVLDFGIVFVAIAPAHMPFQTSTGMDGKRERGIKYVLHSIVEHQVVEE